ncbi:MAG: OmpA family protein [Pseudomonadota bacterium]|nr:OmpA family protein [Pseudomonadota bacterium]
MKVRGYVVAAAVMATVPMVASANDVYPKFTLSGGYSHAFADSDRQTDDGMGFFVGAGIPITPYLNIDFSAFQHTYDFEVGSGDVEENGGKVDFQFVYSRNQLFAPYVGVGAGYLRSKVGGGDSQGESFFDAGVGFNSYPFGTTAVGVMSDLRYRWLDDDNSDNIEDVILRVGLVVPFGTAASKAAAAAPVASKPSSGTDVKTLGAERRFSDVLFGFDQSTLTSTAQSTLDNAASTINELAEQHPSLKVKVDGHTDWVGTDGYNQALGERRANAVKQYLERKGVATDRIDTTSYGESKPVATNETDEGRALNRRAEVRTTAEKE